MTLMFTEYASRISHKLGSISKCGMEVSINAVKAHYLNIITAKNMALCDSKSRHPFTKRHQGNG